MSFKAFLKQNAVLPENRKEVISKRFKAEDGNLELWELRAITEQENANLKQEYTSKTRIKGQQISSFDGNGYMKALTSACLVYPDLKDAELQASYEVVGEVQLLDKMLLPGEFSTLSEIVQEINGFDIDKMIEEVKNS